ncbi:hypothetical protein ESA94_11525 [Lacibacter luteus]|uniref:Uncharacterized protein n=1 Tax=Lacibacter luteus TaxID=2508719 RepID=A0A4Q1CI26_9BACT|nr:hypothetical protein [Lacibacter luteus]RXK59689.1 hypothetical protein ESA94_11525 [Lacibacter luteus]
MTFFKKFLLFYFLNLAIFLLLIILFGRDIIYVIKNPLLVLMPLIPVVPAIFFGAIINTVLSRTDRSIKVFTFTYTGCTLIFSLFIGFTFFSSWNHNRKYGNVEANKDYFRNYGHVDMTDYKISFDTLITRFSNPNDIRITGSMSDVIDTTIENTKQKMRYIRLMYSKYNSAEEYKADFIVYNAAAKMVYYNILLSDSDKKRIADQERKRTKLLRDILKSVEDEAKKKRNE